MTRVFFFLHINFGDGHRRQVQLICWVRRKIRWFKEDHRQRFISHSFFTGFAVRGGLSPLPLHHENMLANLQLKVVGGCKLCTKYDGKIILQFETGAAFRYRCSSKASALQWHEPAPRRPVAFLVGETEKTLCPDRLVFVQQFSGMNSSKNKKKQECKKLTLASSR